MIELNKNFLQYKVGGLLYMPAFQKNIVNKIKLNSIDCLTSVAFCLEDSIRDEALNDAENTLEKILTDLKNIKSSSPKNFPLIFIRVRSPEHLKFVHEKFFCFAEILTGYIFPKFDLSNAENYISAVREINFNRRRPFYVMPILETETIANIFSRNETLLGIKNFLDRIESYVLNVRVGVNDFGNIYGLRRDIFHTVYDLGIIRDIFIDILNAFSKDYVVAGSVWNYFNDGKNNFWAEGLKKELTLDRLNGFIGKSAIHPSQLPYIFESLKVSSTDLEDAEQILNWKSDSHGVVKGNGRMNELKCHLKWAEKIKILSEIYGVKNEKI